MSDFERTVPSPMGGGLRAANASRLWLGLIALVLAGGCSSAKAAIKEASRGSCQSVCHEEHPDSLYDENRCVEKCEPPQ